MNDISSSLFLLISEIGVMLFLILSTIIFLAKKRKMQDKALAMSLVEKIRNAEPEKKEKLLSLLKDTYGYEDEKAEEKIDLLMSHEKNLYNNLLQIFLKKDRDKISQFDRYLDKLIKSYQTIGDGGGESDGDEGGGGGNNSNVVILREENSNLRDANRKLKHDLDAAMETMESMMSEYASMYEGGQQDGEQRMKNEMFKLRRVLENTPAGEEGDDVVDDLDINIEELNLDEDDASGK